MPKNTTYQKELLREALFGEFDESKHKRADDGKFTSKGDSGAKKGTSEGKAKKATANKTKMADIVTKITNNPETVFNLSGKNIRELAEHLDLKLKGQETRENMDIKRLRTEIISDLEATKGQSEVSKQKHIDKADTWAMQKLKNKYGDKAEFASGRRGKRFDRMRREWKDEYMDRAGYKKDGETYTKKSEKDYAPEEHKEMYDKLDEMTPYEIFEILRDIGFHDNDIEGKSRDELYEVAAKKPEKVKKQIKRSGRSIRLSKYFGQESKMTKAEELRKKMFGNINKSAKFEEEKVIVVNDDAADVEITAEEQAAIEEFDDKSSTFYKEQLAVGIAYEQSNGLECPKEAEKLVKVRLDKNIFHYVDIQMVDTEVQLRDKVVAFIKRNPNASERDFDVFCEGLGTSSWEVKNKMLNWFNLFVRAVDTKPNIGITAVPSATFAEIKLMEAMFGEFEENEHPRADDGKFASKSGGGDTASKKEGGSGGNIGETYIDGETLNIPYTEEQILKATGYQWLQMRGEIIKGLQKGRGRVWSGKLFEMYKDKREEHAKNNPPKSEPKENTKSNDEEKNKKSKNIEIDKNGENSNENENKLKITKDLPKIEKSNYNEEYHRQNDEKGRKRFIKMTEENIKKEIYGEGLTGVYKKIYDSGWKNREHLKDEIAQTYAKRANWLLQNKTRAKFWGKYSSGSFDKDFGKDDFFDYLEKKNPKLYREYFDKEVKSLKDRRIKTDIDPNWGASNLSKQAKNIFMTEYNANDNNKQKITPQTDEELHKWYTKQGKYWSH